MELNKESLIAGVRNFFEGQGLVSGQNSEGSPPDKRRLINGYEISRGVLTEFGTDLICGGIRRVRNISF